MSRNRAHVSRKLVHCNDDWPVVFFMTRMCTTTPYHPTTYLLILHPVPRAWLSSSSICVKIFLEPTKPCCVRDLLCFDIFQTFGRSSSHVCAVVVQSATFIVHAPSRRYRLLTIHCNRYLASCLSVRIVCLSSSHTRHTGCQRLRNKSTKDCLLSQ